MAWGSFKCMRKFMYVCMYVHRKPSPDKMLLSEEEETERKGCLVSRWFGGAGIWAFLWSFGPKVSGRVRDLELELSEVGIQI